MAPSLLLWADEFWPGQSDPTNMMRLIGGNPVARA
jgi:hypothetical protein